MRKQGPRLSLALGRKPGCPEVPSLTIVRRGNGQELQHMQEADPAQRAQRGGAASCTLSASHRVLVWTSFTPACCVAT